MDDPPTGITIVPPPANAPPVPPAFALARERLLVRDMTAPTKLPARPRLPWAVWRFASPEQQLVRSPLSPLCWVRGDSYYCFFFS